MSSKMDRMDRGWIGKVMSEALQEAQGELDVGWNGVIA